MKDYSPLKISVNLCKKKIILSEILEEKQKAQISLGKFKEAEKTGDRIRRMKEINQKRKKEEKQEAFSKQREYIKDSQQKEYQSLNNCWDEKYKTVERAFTSNEDKLKTKHLNELKAAKNRYFGRNINLPVPRKEILNKERILQNAIRIKNFSKANEVKGDLVKLSKERKEKYEVEKNIKILSDLSHLKRIQANQINYLNERKLNTLANVKVKQEIENEKLNKKCKNKSITLQFSQDRELKNLKKIEKGVILPTTRIKYILKSYSQAKPYKTGRYE